MKTSKFLLTIFLLNQLGLAILPASARPGEAVDSVLKRFSVEGQQPTTLGDFITYKLSDSKFTTQPTLFLKLGAKGIVLEENFLFDKNTVHEKDVQRSKSDSLPIVNIPHHSYLVGDFSQLPREKFDTKNTVIGTIAAPFGAATGTVVGAGRGLVEGTKIGVQTADSASRALGGDASGKAGAWASSAAAVATGAVTGLFAGLTGGAVEGSVRGARVGLQGVHGADMDIKGITPANSQYVVVGGRIGKELTPEEQKALLDQLAQLEQTRLAGGKPSDKDLADSDADKDKDSKLANLDSAKDKSDFDSSSDYDPEEAANKNVAGMW